MWYGKGPGVDRTGDVFRHANFAGSSKNGGVLALMGDDHTAESSTTAHQSEFHFVDVMIPILNPAGVQEFIDYALYGWAMSRFCGSWVALKCMHETVESTGVVEAGLDSLKIVIPGDDEFKMPPGGLNIRLVDGILDMEARLHDYKRDAMLAFVHANKLNRIITSGGPNAKIGIITVGKSYLDVRQAFDQLGIDEVKCNDLGIRLFKIGCPWPISRAELRDFAKGLELIIVVEEKRSLIEVQVREELYGIANPPVVIGKRDEKEEWLFPVKGALDPHDIAIAVGERVLRRGHVEEIANKVSRLKQAQSAVHAMTDVSARTPYFCSGCPHNSSTVVPQGMRAYAGIGCHFMSQWMDRNTLGWTHMGGEGANWIGEAPFSKRNHVFQNLGDGTYNHSGYLAIRAAAASGVNVTYKILFNDAVAMTGGQRNDGGLTVPIIARQVAAEGAKKIVIVTDEPKKYPSGTDWPPGITIHHRDDLMAVQTGLADVPGLTVLIYDQTCAAEKRRRRKRGQFPDPDKRVVINELVCEGCGDCGVQSNCVSVQPLETEWGRKRTIDQSSCNKDFSCLKGFCPSFVTVEGAKLKRGKGVDAPADLPALPEPAQPAIAQTYSIIVTGVGGTGIVTIGGVLGMAAHLEGKGVGIIDQAGLAQKGGAVYSHIRIAKKRGGHSRDPRRGGRMRSRARRRHGGRRQQEGAVDREARRHHDGDQHRRDPAGRLHPQCGFLAADRATEARHPHRGGRRKDPLRRCDAACHRAARQFDRREHLHGRLRLPARRAAALGGVDREGDRAQRRSGADEPRGVPVRTPRRVRSRRRSRRWSSPRRRPRAMRGGCRNRSTRRWRGGSNSSPPTRMPTMRRATGSSPIR